MPASWTVASYCSARAAEERAHASTARTQSCRLERLALAERWERRATEMERAAHESVRSGWDERS
jgi:hypothetical protein